MSKQNSRHENPGFLARLFGRNDNASEPVPAPPPAKPKMREPLSRSPVYKLKLDALTIVARMNHNRETVGLDELKRQIVFIQSQLVLAAVRDPDVPASAKAALVNFQESSLRESIDDRRGKKRRAAILTMETAANESPLEAAGGAF